VNAQQLDRLLILLATLNTCCIHFSPWTRAPAHSVSLHQRSHKCQLPDCTFVLKNKNFIM